MADSPWLPARIVDVRTDTNTRTTAWVVNTPIQDEETVCTIRVQLQTKVYTGNYKLDESHSTPPPEWVKHSPVRAQLIGDAIFLKGPLGVTYRLHIAGTKSAPPMDPWTPAELEAERAAAEKEESVGSMIGFEDEAKTKHPAAAQPPPPPAPAAPEPPTGTVSVSSMPYLAEVFVDGESMGYTPSKLKLAPGRHSFRCEKSGYQPWTKDITVTAGSEITLDATLTLNRK